MTLAASIPNLVIPQLHAGRDRTVAPSDHEQTEDCFAVILEALGRASSAARCPVADILPGETGNLASSTPLRDAHLAPRAFRFVETGVFGLMQPAAFSRATGGGTASSRQVLPPGPAASDQRRTLDKGEASRAAVIGVEIITLPHSGAAAPRPEESRMSLLHHHSDRTFGATAQLRPSTLAKRPSPPPERPQRTDQRGPVQHRPSPAPAQTSAVHVAIAATERGLQVFARVGRMEPTERTRLRDAATSLLAAYGHRGATVTLDVESLERGGT